MTQINSSQIKDQAITASKISPLAVAWTALTLQNNWVNYGSGLEETLLKQQALDPTTRLASKFISFSRDGTASSGDVSYTGVGFKPTSIGFFSCVQGTSYWSHGFVDSAKSGYCIFGNGAGNAYQTSSPISYSNQSSWAQLGAVKSFDTDGFTLTWTKIGTPSAGTIVLNAICYR